MSIAWGICYGNYTSTNFIQTNLGYIFGDLERFVDQTDGRT
jgi:hypothetical protein